MFLKLPLDIQDKIYKSLSVQDRVKLNMALPKENKSRYKCIKEEKKLGLISKVLKKRKVKKISNIIRIFLSDIDETDPTLTELSEEYPIINNLNKKKIINLNNIDINTLTKDDIMPLLKKLTIEDFNKLLDNTYIKPILSHSNEDELYLVKYERNRFLFELILENHELFEYIAKNNLCDINCVRESLKFTLISKKNYELILKYFKITKEELEDMYDYVIEYVNFELIEIIGKELELI